MTQIPEPLQLPFLTARFAGDKAHEPSADELNEFRKLMGSFQHMTATTAMYSVFGGIGNPQPNLDGPPVATSSDRIKAYVQGRITARMNEYDVEGLDFKRFSMGADAMGWALNASKSDPASQNLSSLLNMHFDLNTLQMLNMGA